MNKGRLEAFSDGVRAVIITLMVLELRAPRGESFETMRPLLPGLLTYVLSFIFVGIYWNNHHHMLHATRRVNGKILWANLHLLFWLSLIPLIMGWIGNDPRSSAPAAAYGVILLMAALAYTVLQRAIIAYEGSGSALARAVGRDVKGKIYLGLYVLAIGLAFVQHWIADVIYVVVAVIWLVPDRRIERMVEAKPPE